MCTKTYQTLAPGVSNFVSKYRTRFTRSPGEPGETGFTPRPRFTRLFPILPRMGNQGIKKMGGRSPPTGSPAKSGSPAKISKPGEAGFTRYDFDTVLILF